MSARGFLRYSRKSPASMVLLHCLREKTTPVAPESGLDAPFSAVSKGRTQVLRPPFGPKTRAPAIPGLKAKESAVRGARPVRSAA